MEDYRLEQSGQEVQNILDGAAMQTDLTAENERAEREEQALQGAIDDEALARGNADTTLQGHIDDEEARAKAAEKQNADDIDAIEEKIPSGASSENKLATEDYVNDSVATASATFRGTYNLVTDLHMSTSATRAGIASALGTAISGADNNDYAFVMIPTSEETPTEIARVERYKFNGTAWGFEYTLNNSGYTSAQWAAINSGITSELVQKLGPLPSADDLAAALLAKQDKLTFDSAPTPESTNPVTSGGVYTAVDNEKGARQNADQQLQQAIEAILALIPSAATALNQLADKAFVNSSIATDTSTFRGTYNLVTDLHLAVNASHSDIATALLTAASSADNNDYCFVQVPTSVDTPTEIRVTERYKFDGTAWAYEYDLNNSGFTAQQWEAINSAITSALVSKLSALPTAAELATELAGKQAVLTFDNQPTSGSSNPVKSGGVYDVVAAINAKIPSDADAANKMTTEARIATIIGALDATFDLTSADGHITFKMTQTDGLIASVQILTYDIASAAALTTLGGRVSLNESDISNLQAAYAALTQSDVIIVNGALPSSGQQQNIIYRQPDPDHTPPQFYSDFMWNGTTWVLMGQYNNAIDPRPKKGSQNLVTSGGVFDNMGALDVSELNATENPHTLATYADLSAALAAIPSDYQKGGMSIKFVLTSDNMYIQYRLLSDDWSINPDDWSVLVENVLVESDTFKWAVADKNRKIAVGIKADGTVFFGAGCPPQVIQLIENVVAELTDSINTKVDKVDGKSLIDEIYASCQNAVESEDWAKVITDFANRIVEGYNNNGDKVIFADTYHKGLLDIQGTQFDAVDSEDWTEVKTDKYGRVISYRDAKGKLHELAGIEFPDGNSLKSIKELPVITSGSKCNKHSLTKNDSTKLLTVKDVTTSKSGWLTSVRFYSSDSGIKTLYIGYLDQRSWAITRKSFNVTAVSGINDVDISEQHLMVDVGENIFIEASNINYGELAQGESYPQLLYGPKDGALVVDSSTYGASMLLEWDVMPIESLYPFVEDFNSLQSTVSELNLLVLETSVNENIVFDDNGNPYKLTVDNGEVVPVLQRFKKILVLGNSTTEHDISTVADVRWLAGGRGMASTTPDNDFVHYIEEGFKAYDNTAEVVRHLATEWERNLPTDPAVLAGYLTGYGTGYDLIVFTCCANITSTDSNQIYESTKAFMQVIQQTWTTAKLVVTSNFAHMYQSVVTYDYRELAMLKATSELNIPYINIGLNENDSFISNFNTGGWVPMYAEGSGLYEGTKFPIQEICMSHPSDIGMYKIAKNILSALYYSLSDSIHNITCTCSQQHYCPDYWVKDGLVTVFCYDNLPSSVVCKDSNDNDISTTIKDMSQESLYTTPNPAPVAAVVFTMPDTDVSITIN